MKNWLWTLIASALLMVPVAPTWANDGDLGDEFALEIEGALNDLNGAEETPVPRHKVGAKQTQLDFSEAPTVETLDNSTAEMTIENESIDADIIALQLITEDNSKETQALQNEIVRLERDFKGLKSNAERAKTQSELSYKRLELKKQVNKEAQKRLAQAEQLKRQTDRRLTTLRERVRTTEQAAANAKSRTKERQSELKNLASEQRTLERRMKRATAQLEQEKVRQKALREKRARLMESKRRVKSKLSRVERLARNE
jgi:chromosome segregation ATPase